MNRHQVTAEECAVQAEQVEGVRLTWLVGTRMLPKPTGRWVQDRDGGWYEEHTNAYTLGPDGKRYDEQPYVPVVKLYGMDVVVRPGWPEGYAELRSGDQVVRLVNVKPRA